MTISAGSYPTCPPFIKDEERHRREITQWMFRIEPFTKGANLPNFVNDAAAAAGGVAVGAPYRNGSVLMVRIA